jgi:hypothetical protein
MNGEPIRELRRIGCISMTNKESHAEQRTQRSAQELWKLRIDPDSLS